MVRDGARDVGAVGADVGEGEEGVAAREGVVRVVGVALHLRVRPHGRLLAVRHHLLDELVHVRRGVKVGRPQRLAVVGVVSAVEELLRAIVDDGDALRVQREDDGVLVLLRVARHGQEPRVVVVVDEGAQQVGVLEGAVRLQHGLQLEHGAARCEHGAHGEEQRVRQDPVERLALEGRDVAHVAVEDLAHRVHAHLLLEVVPEAVVDLGHRVGAHAVEAKVVEQHRRVLQQAVVHELLALVEVGQAREAAVLHLRAVVPVRDVAVGGAAVAVVEVGGLVEGHEAGAADAARVVAHVVHHHIHHDPHARVVRRLHQRLQVVSGAHVRVHLGEVALPVAVVAARRVVDDRRDPDGIEAHAGDVGHLLRKSLPRAAAVVAQVTVPARRIVEAVRDHLVDGALRPFCWRAARHDARRRRRGRGVHDANRQHRRDCSSSTKAW
mmetsp:Transcript_20292/g.71761  ORF Transcript_20292/g.71761 Transcript_20292/m.71761 type:complete len:438 (+) Transcript_20292:258-1571(+)